MSKWILLILCLALLCYNHKPTKKEIVKEPYEKTIHYISDTYTKDDDKARIYVNHAVAYGNKYNIDPLLILAIMEVESSFNEQAYNPSGAVGLMQVIPRYHPEIWVSYHPADAIHAGAYVLRKYINQYKSIKEALNHYGGDLSGNYYRKVINKKVNLEQNETST